MNVTSNEPEFYIVPGNDLRREVSERYDKYISRVGNRPRNADSKHAAVDPSDAKKWKNRWSLFG